MGAAVVNNRRHLTNDDLAFPRPLVACSQAGSNHGAPTHIAIRLREQTGPSAEPAPRLADRPSVTERAEACAKAVRARRR
jgi:hypothetical protein